MLPAAFATTSFQYAFSSVNPPPHFTVITMCALLTRDLFAIAKFLICTVIMIRSGTSSTYSLGRLTGLGFDLTWFGSLFSERLDIIHFLLHRYLVVS